MDMIKKAYKDWTFDCLNFPKSFETKGTQKVPKYYYRDDGLKLWRAITNFVKGVVSVYYHTEKDVQTDLELQVRLPCDLNNNT